LAPTVVQITFTLNMSSRDYEQAITPLSHAVADVAGLQWKIWLLNEATHEASGIALFEDMDSANAFVQGPLIGQITSAPSIADFRAAQFDVLSSITAITRGPVKPSS
jgi:hypothetical protein